MMVTWTGKMGTLCWVPWVQGIWVVKEALGRSRDSRTKLT